MNVGVGVVGGVCLHKDMTGAKERLSLSGLLSTTEVRPERTRLFGGQLCSETLCKGHTVGRFSERFQWLWRVLASVDESALAHRPQVFSIHAMRQTATTSARGHSISLVAADLHFSARRCAGVKEHVLLHQPSVVTKRSMALLAWRLCASELCGFSQVASLSPPWPCANNEDTLWNYASYLWRSVSPSDP